MLRNYNIIEAYYKQKRVSDKSNGEHQLEVMDEHLAEYLRIVHETVRTRIAFLSFNHFLSASLGMLLLTEVFQTFASNSRQRTLLPTPWNTKTPKGD